jgi:hypothetical protein
MPVQSSARLGLVAGDSFHHWDSSVNRGLLKGFGERSTLTERRRSIVHDHAGSRRPQHFLEQQKVSYLQGSRHSKTLKLRRLERKVLFWKSLWSAIFGILQPRKINRF